MSLDSAFQVLDDERVSIPVILVCSKEQAKKIAGTSSPITPGSIVKMSSLQDEADEDFESKKETSALELLKTSASETTLHGIRYLFDRGVFPLRRYLWLMVVLTCFGFCMFQFYIRATKYMRPSESVSLDVISVNKMDFPRVVICNKNLFKMTMLKEYRHFVLELFDLDNIEPDLEKQIGYLDQVNTNLTNLTKEYMKRGHQLQDMLVKCNFAGAKCTADNFTAVITEYGICYQFNGDGTKLTVNNAGLGSGLALVLDAEQYEYSSSFQNSAGIYLSVQASNEALLLRKTSIAIPIGFETLVGLELTELAENVDGDCFSTILKNQTEYSVTACRLECLTDYVVQNCGCKGNYMPGNYPECRFNLQFTCVRFFSTNFTESEAARSCECPPVCVERIYETVTSKAPLSYSRSRALALDVRKRNKQIIGGGFVAKYDVIARLSKDQTWLHSYSEASEYVIEVVSAFCIKSSNLTNQLKDILTFRSFSPNLLSSIEVALNATTELFGFVCNNSMVLSGTDSNLEAMFWQMGRDTFFSLLLSNYSALFEDVNGKLQLWTNLIVPKLEDVIQTVSTGEQ